MSEPFPFFCLFFILVFASFNMRLAWMIFSIYIKSLTEIGTSRLSTLEKKKQKTKRVQLVVCVAKALYELQKGSNKTNKLHVGLACRWSDEGPTFLASSQRLRWRFCLVAHQPDWFACLLVCLLTVAIKCLAAVYCVDWMRMLMVMMTNNINYGVVAVTCE